MNVFLSTAQKNYNLIQKVDLSTIVNEEVSTQSLMDSMDLLSDIPSQVHAMIFKRLKNVDEERYELLKQNFITLNEDKYMEYIRVLEDDVIIALNTEKYKQILNKIIIDNNSRYHRDCFTMYRSKEGVYYNADYKHFYYQIYKYAMDEDILSRSIFNGKDAAVPLKNITGVKQIDILNFFTALNKIVKNYVEKVDNQILVVEEEMDENLDKVKELFKLNQKKNIDFNYLSAIYQLVDKNELNLEQTLDMLRTIVVLEKESKETILPLLELSLKTVKSFTLNDFSFMKELVKKEIDLDTMDVERFNSLRNYLIEGNIYNALVIDKFIYLLNNKELPIEINISEQMKIYNTLISVLEKVYKAHPSKFNVVLTNLSLLNIKKSKNFLNLIDSRMNVIESIDATKKIPLIFTNEVIQNVQLNQFSEKTIDLFLTSDEEVGAKEGYPKDTKLTPELFYVVKDHSFKLKVLNLLTEKNIKNDVITRILKSFVSVREGKNLIDENDYLSILKDFTEKELNNLHHYNSEYPKTLSKQNAFTVHLLKRKYEIFNQVTNDNEVEFLLSNDDNLGIDLKEMFEETIKNNTSYVHFKKSLGASELFFEKYNFNLINFFYKNSHKIVNSYVDGIEKDQAKNALLLAKAEIAGRLHEVKFSQVENELEETLSDDFKQKWTTLKTKKGEFTVKEVIDFNTLMNLGVFPVQSCMNYKSGAYRRCLLSIFDSTKQYIGVYDKNDVLIGRAILRLTKTTDDTDTNSNKIGFIDVEKDLEANDKLVTIKSKTTKPVLFIERLYTSYTGRQATQIRKEIVELVREKANELGIEFIAANSYNDVLTLNTDYKKEMAIFICHSQNGKQYLDSFGGQASENAGGGYKRISNYCN